MERVCCELVRLSALIHFQSIIPTEQFTYISNFQPINNAFPVGCGGIASSGGGKNIMLSACTAAGTAVAAKKV